MAILFLVRHGQASFRAQNYDRLSDLGRQQCRWLGEYFASRSLCFTRILSGALNRHTASAHEILVGMGIHRDVEVHPGLNEYDGEALYTAYTRGADPRAHQIRDYHDYWRTFRSAHVAWSSGQLAGVRESWADFGARIRSALRGACDGTVRADSILVVTSGGVIGHTVAEMLGAPAATSVELNLQVRNASFCEIIVGGRATRLLSFNSIPHLELPGRREAITST